MTENQIQIANSNFARLQENTYPGRLMVLGLDESGENMVQLYALTGRSEPSQNRKFVPKKEENGWITIEAADPTKLDPNNPDKNRFYDPMREVRNCFVVTNGEQINDIIRELARDQTGSISAAFNTALRRWSYEDDGFTSRISGVCSRSKSPLLELSIIRKSAENKSSERDNFQRDSVPKGFGHFTSTYESDGKPPPPFEKMPLLMPLEGCQKAILQRYWDALPPSIRVAIAVKFIPVKAGKPSVTCIINRFAE